MVTTYFVSFRIADEANTGPIYDKLHKAVENMAGQGMWWFETTSFYVFESDMTASAIASQLMAII